MATFAEWTERLKVFGELLKADGERRLNLAKASLEEARAAGQIIKVRALQQLLKHLETERRQLLKQRRKLERQIDTINADGKLVERLLRGRCFDTMQFGRARSTLRRYLADALLEDAGQSLFSASIPQKAKSASNFVNCKANSPTSKPAPDELENGLELVDWMLTNRHIPLLGKPAHKVLRDVIAAIDNVAGVTVKELEDVLDKVVNNKLDTWQDRFTMFGDTPSKRG